MDIDSFGIMIMLYNCWVMIYFH